MCLATVYVEGESQPEELMRDVAWIYPKPEGLELTSFLGESKLVQAEIEYINLIKSVIVLRKSERMVAEGSKDGRADPSQLR